MNCFSLAAFRILSLTFVILIIICLGVGLFGFILLGPSVLPVPGCVSFFRFGKFSAIIISSNTFLIPFPAGEGAPRGTGVFALSQLPPRGAGPVQIPFCFFIFYPTWSCGDSFCPFRSVRSSASIQ